MLGNKVLPTTINGLALNNLDFFDIIGYKNLVRFRAIQTIPGIHNLQIQYYKQNNE